MVFKKGLVAWNKGTPMSDDQKEKRSLIMKDRPAHNKGIPMSDAQKLKISQSKKGQAHPQTEETKIKISLSNTGKVFSEKHRKNISIAMKGKPSPHKGIKRSKESNIKNSEAQKGKVLSEEHKIKIRETTKIVTNTQEFRNNQSIRSKKMWADPVFKDRQIKIIKEVHNRPDVIKNHARAYAHRPHKNTDIEIILEKLINSLNIKYESQKYTQFGVPDFFVQPNICIFADGNYDHTRPNKIEKDKKQTQNLENIGYIVYRFWGSDIKKYPERILNELKLIY